MSWEIVSVRLLNDRGSYWTVGDNACKISLGLGDDGGVSTVQIDLNDGKRRVEVPRNQVTITWEKKV